MHFAPHLRGVSSSTKVWSHFRLPKSSKMFKKHLFSFEAGTKENSYFALLQTISALQMGLAWVGHIPGP